MRNLTMAHTGNGGWVRWWWCFLQTEVVGGVCSFGTGVQYDGAVGGLFLVGKKQDSVVGSGLVTAC